MVGHDESSFLRQMLSTIAPLSPESWALFASSIGRRHLEKGELFTRVGDQVKEGGLVLSGFMRTYYLQPDGHEVVTAFCEEGSFSCAYAAALNRQPSRVSIEAAAPTVVATFSIRRFRELVESENDWSTIGRRLVEADYVLQEQRLSQLLTQNAQERIKNFRTSHKTLWTLASQRDIASYLGMTRETLNRLANKALHE